MLQLFAALEPKDMFSGLIGLVRNALSHARFSLKINGSQLIGLQSCRVWEGATLLDWPGRF